MLNNTEKKAYIWLQAKGYQGISFSSNKTPDFIVASGESFEVKKVRNNTIVFSNKQFESLQECRDSKILAFNDSPEPIAIIPFGEIAGKPKFWGNIRILTSIMSKRKGSEANSEFLTVNEIAERLKVHPQTVYRWIYAKKLEALKIDGILRIEEEAYNRFLRKEDTKRLEPVKIKYLGREA